LRGRGVQVGVEANCSEQNKRDEQHPVIPGCVRSTQTRNPEIVWIPGSR
jgi:hypothetical protein